MQYYAQNAKDFFNRTAKVDASALYPKFLNRVAPGGHILDAGCGSGRDSFAFLKLGYQVTSFDATPELAELASEHIKRPVAVRSFFDVDEQGVFDAIWANASLLHVPQTRMPEALGLLWTALKPEGVLYCSFKFGNSMREVEGRLFTDANIPRFDNWRRQLIGVSSKEIWLSDDLRKEVDQRWFNALLVKSAN